MNSSSISGIAMEKESIKGNNAVQISYWDCLNLLEKIRESVVVLSKQVSLYACCLLEVWLNNSKLGG